MPLLHSVSDLMSLCGVPLVPLFFSTETVNLKLGNATLMGEIIV
jgi:hypothetical protein